MRVAFLGLGAIGAPMAAHLARQHDLTVWNRTPERAAEFVARYGGRAVPTARAAAQGAEAVLTCLPTSAEVEVLLEGPEGLEAGLARGVILIDCTSGDPATSRRVAERLARREVAFVDAPVSGGTNGAEAGTLTVMLGGEPEACARARPLLEAFGKRIERMGPVGAGHAMKAVNNALLAVNILALGEGLTALARAGVAPRAAVEVLNVSSGRSFVSEVLIPERVLSGSWPRTFRLALLAKDARIAVEFLAEQGIEGPVLELAVERLRAIRPLLAEAADYLDPIRLAEERAGVELRG